jgi:plastocyanin
VIAAPVGKRIDTPVRTVVPVGNDETSAHPLSSLILYPFPLMPQTTGTPVRSRLPFKFSTAGHYAGLRTLFRDSGFTVGGIGERLGIPDVHEFVSLRSGREGSAEVSDELDAMIRLFLDGEPVPRQRLEVILPASALRLLESLSLVVPHPEQADALAATVRLYPIENVYVASDLVQDAPGVSDESTWTAEDQVYAASTVNTRTFLRMLPRAPTERFLELCAGTGIAALLTAPHATRAWATDVTERATAFAEFNAQLNGIENFEARRGDVIRYTLISGVHNVNFLADSNRGKSGLPAAGPMLQLPMQRYDVKVTWDPGRYFYQCDPHALLGMVGYVTVVP